MKKKKKTRAAARKRSGAARRSKSRVGTIRASAEEPRQGSVEFGAMYRPIKKPVTLRLDADVVAWFKTDGRGYQTRINQALRKVMKDEKRRGG